VKHPPPTSNARSARVQVPEALAGARLDKVLAQLVPELSRREARKVLAMGAVTIGRKRVRIASWEVRAGDEIALTWHPDVLVPEHFALEIVYQDAAIAVVSKPAGQLSQGSELGDVGSLQYALMRHFGPHARLMHRLDKGASGLLVAGLGPDATGYLTPQFRAHTLERRYLALTAGTPAEGRCEVPIVIAGREARAARPGEDGLPATTDVAILEHVADSPLGPVTLVAASLTTGRTHQIRIHLQALGAPLVGDPAYGGPEAGRLALHAATLGFAHPDGTSRRFERPPDADFWQAAGLAPRPAPATAAAPR
jgi:23S rRNA pseudouridine1911/1915/1917 synthase